MVSSYVDRFMDWHAAASPVAGAALRFSIVPMIDSAPVAVNAQFHDARPNEIARPTKKWQVGRGLNAGLGQETTIPPIVGCNAS
jgi:hypothetical protein